MVSRDCLCTLLSGQAVSNCRICGGTGVEPPSSAEVKKVHTRARQILASGGNIRAMKALAEEGELWPIEKDPF